MNGRLNTAASRRRVRAAAALLALLTLLLLPVAAAAQDEPAGRVNSLVGEVRAIDSSGNERELARGDAVHPGDTLTLGDRAHVQLRMHDEALVELEAGTRFAIEHYEVADDGGHIGMRLLRGALRTITGVVGHRSGDDYRVHTPVATIGVRGTQYALEFCGAECATDARASGLYGRVDEGVVSASNQAATREFGKREYFYVADTDVAPREIVRPPKGILDGGAVSSGALTPESVLEDGTLSNLGGTVDDLGDTTGDALGDLTGTLGTTIGGDLGDTLTGTGDTLDQSLTDSDNDLIDTTEDVVEDTGDTIEDTADSLL